jgi:hypothetical protein
MNRLGKPPIDRMARRPTWASALDGVRTGGARSLGRYPVAFFRSARRAFIRADSRLRAAALKWGGFRAAFLGFCFAHHAFLAAPMRRRAARLMVLRLAVLGGRPGPRLGPRPSRAAIARSKRLR